MLSATELSRYGRQLVLPELGIAGQERLRRARVLVVGAGGLGSPAALYLAAGGIGTLGIIDQDSVELSNLHRQIVHGSTDVGRSKVDSARDALHRLNPHTVIHAYHERLTATRALELFRDYDLVVDGSDNFAARYAVNDACAALHIPWVYGSVERFAGQVSVFGAADGPCYRCVFPEPPEPGSAPSCEEVGVLGAVPGVVGSLQATEALKWILGIGVPLAGRLLQLDFLGGAWHTIALARRDDCAACSARAQHRPATIDAKTMTASDQDFPDIEPSELAQRLATGDAPQLLDIRERWEVTRAQIASPRHIAMSELPSALDTLDRSEEIVVFCHHGARSRMAAEWLRAEGFRARNLAGGIDRWSREIDPSVPRY